ncbi:MAG: hypothetical protein Q4B85_00470 [Lachnospiraceae bacterium]|nr:hypothetical protein [Lachnospiraceae bacterium]
MDMATTWLEQFYHETEQEDREEIFQAGLKEEGMTRENEFRKKLWELRYVPCKGEKAPVDHYMKIFLSIDTLGRTKPGFFSNRFIQKEIQSLKGIMGMDLAEEYGEMGKELLFEELKHLARTYITICQDDRNFSTMILGVGKLSKEKLTEKIADKVYFLTREVPALHHFEELVEPFSRAMIQVYYEMYPKKADRRRLQERLEGRNGEENMHEQ